MPARCQQLAHRAAGGGAEDRQRRVLGGDDRHRELDVHVVGAPGGHQRELVQRQLPRHPPRRDEREAVHVAALDVLDQPVQRLVQAAVVDRQRVLVARVRLARRAPARARRTRSARRPWCARAAWRGRPTPARRPAAWRRRRRRSARAGSAGPGRRRTARARSSGGRRTRVSGAITRHVGALGRELAQRQRRLQRGHAAAGDDHAELLRMRGVGGGRHVCREAR